MVEAFILVQTDVGKASQVAGKIALLPGIRTAEDVVGPYDVIARASADSDSALAEVVTAVQAIDGITRTLNCTVAGS
ncbi:Lrp/AsnC ligand binding domain-containing protein [Antrihabitans stalactiti]|uniref:Lrp/AsnC family transcriptional regulator n=1 Tax=Antrihabitans stalactiti TaxID=2584121 RepID=A0A848K6K0_9NOCA|nr:Lrp/AsnC family transcriptional regulator [Antrihabitans stalactiti]